MDDVTLTLLDLSDMFLILTRPVIPEIRGARVFIELLQRMGYAMDKVGLVINGVENKRMGIQPEAIERAMMPALARIPLDERVALRAANYGVPFVLQEPHAVVTQAINALAQTLSQRLGAEMENIVPNMESQPRRRGLGHLL